MKKILLYTIGILLTVAVIGTSAYMAYLQKMSSTAYYQGQHAIENHGSNDTVRRDDMLLRQIHIHYEGDTAIVTGAYSGSGLNVGVQGAQVNVSTSSIYPTEYTLSGASEKGCLRIQGAAPQTIILNGVELASTEGAAINVQSPAKTLLLLASGSTNRLADHILRTDTIEESDACLFTLGDLRINGSGSLIIEGRHAHAIASEGDITLDNGHITVPHAVKDGLHAKFDYEMKGGTVELPHFGTPLPGILPKRADGIEGKRDVRIFGGDISIRHHGERGRGITAGRSLEIHGGNIDVETTGDGIMRIKKTGEVDASSAACLKSDGNIYISCGNLNLTARGKGGKCINADSTLTLGIVHDDNTHLHIAMLTEGAQVEREEGSAKAIKADGDIYLHSGTFHVTTRAYGAEGVESKSNIYINNGILHITARDDAMNTTGRIVINGGDITAISTGNDALDSNYRGYGAYTQTGGCMAALSLAGDPEEGIDCDQSPLAISGGTLFTAGGSMGGHVSMPNERTAKQPVALLEGFTLGEGEQLTLYRADSLLLSYSMPGTIRRSYSLISTPALSIGNDYQVTLDGKLLATYTQATPIEYIENSHPEEPMHPPFGEGGFPPPPPFGGPDGPMQGSPPLFGEGDFPPPPFGEDGFPPSSFGGDGSMPPPGGQPFGNGQMPPPPPGMMPMGGSFQWEMMMRMNSWAANVLQ